MGIYASADDLVFTKYVGNVQDALINGCVLF